jgi:hypothetical protein
MPILSSSGLTGSNRIGILKDYTGPFLIFAQNTHGKSVKTENRVKVV